MTLPNQQTELEKVIESIYRAIKQGYAAGYAMWMFQPQYAEQILSAAKRTGEVEQNAQECAAQNLELSKQVQDLEQKLKEVEKKSDEFKRAEKEVSEAYLRVRTLLNAFDTNHGGANRFEVTENKIKQLHSLATQLAEALSHYAKRDMWTDHVIDSHSGLCWFFDWDGDLQDEPYELAEKALQLAKERGLI